VALCGGNHITASGAGQVHSAGPVFPALLAQIGGANAAAWQQLYVASSFDLLLYLLTAGRQAA